MIFIPVVEESIEKARTIIHEASYISDLFEIRVDYLKEFKPDDLVELELLTDEPLIITVRPEREGGKWKGSEEDRIAILQKAVDLGFSYVDVEWDTLAKIRKTSDTQIIGSYHNFDETPADVFDIYEKLASTQADIVKIATTARAIEDNITIFELLKKATKPTIALCMGELGMISRILGRKFGNLLTFATFEGKGSASGQVDVEELKSLYRYERIDKDTDIYGVIGNPVAHSKSPAIMNTAFEKEGINCVYVPFKVADVVTFVNAFKRIDVNGYSVTIPHKNAALGAVDEMDPLVEKIGALNTIVNKDGKLTGYNTDMMAAVGCIEDAFKEMGESSFAGKKFLVIGAGGVSQAICFGLAEKGADLYITDIIVDKAVNLAEKIDGGHISPDDIAAVRFDCIINCTGVGMYPDVDKTPLAKDNFRAGMVVFDVVYNPMKTRFLTEAAEAGAKTISGVDMFVGQAVRQFELWTGCRAPVEAMRDVVIKSLTKD